MSDIHIAFAATQNWFNYTQVSIVSILEHANPNDNYYFYIMSDNFTNEEKESFLALNKIREAKYNFFVMDNSIYDKFSIYDHLGYATNYRLNLPSLVNVDKILYLDTDIIAMNNIAELYNTDINDYYIGAIIDKCSEMMRPRINSDENFVFINAGVILMNLKAFRENNLEEKMMKYLEENKICGYIDQDAINYYCYKKMKYLPLKYNLMVGTSYTPSYKQEEVLEAYKNPTVIHFVPKPWNSPELNKFYKEWKRLHEIVNKLTEKNTANI